MEGGTVMKEGELKTINYGLIVVLTLVLQIMKKIILFIIIWITITSKIKATAVIVLIYPDRIILAVDSRLTYISYKTGEKKYNSGCKLSMVNGFAFAFTGYRGNSGNISASYENFNTDSYIKSVLNKHMNSLDQTFSELLEGLEKQLTNQMIIMRNLNFKDYSEYLKHNNGNFINLVVIGNDNGLPFAFALKTILSETNGIPSIKATASVFEKKTTVIHAGGTDVVAKYIKDYPSLLQKEEPLPLIEKLMTLVIKDKPLEVGPPIDIVEVKGITGVKWIRKKTGCPI